MLHLVRTRDQAAPVVFRAIHRVCHDEGCGIRRVVPELRAAWKASQDEVRVHGRLKSGPALCLPVPQAEFW